MKSKRLSFTDDRANTAYHEAGHAVVARALGLYAESLIWWDGSQPDRRVMGVTVHVPKTTRYNNAVIGWAGLVGEIVGLYRFDGFPANVLDFTGQLTWDYYTDHPEALSGADADSIYHGKTSSELSSKALKQAVAIIIANLDKLHQCAGELIHSLSGKNNKEEQLKVMQANWRPQETSHNN
jgi:hypothetical protein